MDEKVAALMRLLLPSLRGTRVRGRVYDPTVGHPRLIRGEIVGVRGTHLLVRDGLDPPAEVPVETACPSDETPGRGIPESYGSHWEHA